MIIQRTSCRLYLQRRGRRFLSPEPCKDFLKTGGKRLGGRRRVPAGPECDVTRRTDARSPPGGQCESGGEATVAVGSEWIIPDLHPGAAPIIPLLTSIIGPFFLNNHDSVG